MPHLSPLNWLMMPLSFWFLFLLYVTSSWWITPPSTSPSTISSPLPLRIWSWN